VSRPPDSGCEPAADGLGLTLGLVSHTLAGLSPFIVAAVIARTGLLPGTALVYSLGAAVIAAALLVTPWRRRLMATTRTLIQPPLRNALLTSLAGFVVAGVAYYVGLASSARVAEYVFLTRLDWVVQAPVAILVLREPWTRAGLGSAAIALSGGLLLVWTGAIGRSGVIAAGCYVVASLAGYLGATRIARAAGRDGALALTVWRHWVNTAGFVVLALALAPAAAVRLEPSTMAIALLSAMVLLGLFVTRFTALTRLPLWVLSAQAPVQALVALTMSRLVEGRIPRLTLVAVAMVVCGECLLAMSQRPRG
jgi:hypothetical protein